MKIYIVFPGPLYPISGMSQIRMVSQLTSLIRKGHQVVFSDLLSRPDSLRMAEEKLSGMNIKYEPVYLYRYGKGKILNIIDSILRRLLYELKTISRQELAVSTKPVIKQILQIANANGVEALMLHYWHLGKLFSLLDKVTLRIMDTHYLVEEHVELMAEGKYNEHGYKAFKHKRELLYSLHKQRSYFQEADLVVVNSEKQQRLIHSWDERIPVNVTVNGQDLTRFLNYTANNPQEPAVCFYGALSNQFNRRALKLILAKILPLIKASIPEVRLYVIGANPPLDILDQNGNDSVMVTGYVEDVRPYLGKCKVLLLPLETGSGFRGRTVEVMAMGIPIVGTNNALQSVGFIDGELGYIEETAEGIAQRAVELLKDESVWQSMAANCRTFAAQRFTLEATFDKLAEYLDKMGEPCRVRD